MCGTAGTGSTRDMPAAGFVRQVLEQSAGGPNVLTPPCGRRSSAASRRRSARSYSVCTAFPVAVRLRAAALLASSRIAWMKTNRMAKKMAKRRVKSGRAITRGVSTKEAPAKAGGQSLGYTDDALRA